MRAVHGPGTTGTTGVDLISAPAGGGTGGGCAATIGAAAPGFSSTESGGQSTEAGGHIWTLLVAGPPPGQSEPSEEVSRLLAVDSEDFTWVAAAKGSLDSASYQLATGDPVMPLGGFGGADPSPTLEQFQDYVKQRRIHYYIESSLPGMPSRAEGPDSTWESDRISDWIAQRYTATSVDGVTLYDLTSPR